MALIITYNKTFDIISKLIGNETEGTYSSKSSSASSNNNQNQGSASAPKSKTTTSSTQGSQQKRATEKYGAAPQAGGKIPLVEFWTSYPLFYSGTQVKNEQKATSSASKDKVTVKLSDLTWNKDKKVWTDPNGTYGDANATYKTKVDKLIMTFKVHKNEKSSIEQCYIDIKKHYGLEKIYELGLNTCSGTYCPRNIRGGNTYSMHSWGIAIDILAGLNGLNTKSPKAQFSKPEYKKFLEIMEQNGWYSLGKTLNYDYMHFQTVKY